MRPDPGADHARRASSPATASTWSSPCGPATASAAHRSRATSTRPGGSLAVTEDGIARRLRVELPEELMPYVVERGSVALAGVSLTIAALGEDWIEVSLIPETLERTTLAALEEGDRAQRRVRRAGALCAAAVAGRVTLIDRKRGLMAKRPEQEQQAEAGGDDSVFSSIEEAIEDIRRGRMVVVCDGEDRENEGDLVMAAQFATPEAVNFMATHARGLICLALTPQRCDELGLDLMAAKNESPLETAFTVTIEAARGGHHRHLRPGPRPHRPGRDRPARRARGPAPARPRLPAQGARGRRARAHRPHRGQRRPRPPRRPDPGRGDLRDHERRRHHGPRPGPGPLLRAARAEDGHGRRPDRLPAHHREAGRAHRRDPAADQVRRVHRGRLPLAAGRQAPRGDGQGRGRRRRRRARPGPLRVPHRRRLPQPALRLRRAARGCAGDDRAGGARACCSTSPRRDAASACSTSCAPTGSRRRASTRSTPTSSSACPRICATTGSAPRSSGTSACRASASSPTTRRRSSGSRATASRSPSRCRSSRSPIPTTRPT